MKRSFKRPSSEASQNDERAESVERSSKRRPTVYDAVAGRVTQWGLNNPATTISASKSSTGQPLRPDEVLYKARNAPTRYEETDHYFAHARLPPEQQLPSGDLLSALHSYVSNYYARSEERVNQKVWKSMDETALLALGILLEESAREVLGESGDLVFTEGLREDEAESLKAGVGGDATVSRRAQEEEQADDDDGDDDDGDDEEHELKDLEEQDDDDGMLVSSGISEDFSDESG